MAQQKLGHHALVYRKTIAALATTKLLWASGGFPGSCPATFKIIVGQRSLHVKWPHQLMFHFIVMPGKMDRWIKRAVICHQPCNSFQIYAKPGSWQKKTELSTASEGRVGIKFPEFFHTLFDAGQTVICLKTKDIAQMSVLLSAKLFPSLGKILPGRKRFPLLSL